MPLPVFTPGSTVIIENRWQDLLWSAVPQRVVSSSPDELVGYVPTGTTATRASNRDLPGTESLTRDERKLLALKNRVARVAEVPEAPDKLFIHRPDRWAQVNLGWDQATGEFLGWYVNFELPAEATPFGLCTMDLVLDIWVNPDRSWQWKDRDDYRQALDDGILDPAIRSGIDVETDRVLDELSAATGPFADHWLTFWAEAPQAVPVLPADYAWGGRCWALPTGRRVTASS